MARTSKSFSAWDQFLCMSFAQMTFRESLRDIEACLADRPQLYLMGIRGNVTRTNLAYAGEHRDWRVFADLAAHLIVKARRLYAGDTTGLDIEQMVSYQNSRNHVSKLFISMSGKVIATPQSWQVFTTNSIVCE